MRRIVASLLLLLAPAAAASIHGTIVADKHPVADAKITAYAVESRDEKITRFMANRTRVVLATATSAADGTFTLPTEGAGCVDVRVEAAAFASSVTEQALGDSHVVIVLPLKHSREITLRSPDGAVAGARIVVFLSNWDDSVEAVTDDRGTFTLDYPDAEAILVIHPRLSRGSSLDLHDLHDDVVNVDAGVTLKGKVVDARGAGVRNAQIWVDMLPIGKSGPDGSFTIERAPRDYGLLTAKAGELAGSIPYTTGPLTISIKPHPRLNEVKGVVRDVERWPLRGISITIQGDNNNDVEFALTDEKGAFAVRVAPGKYTIVGVGAAYGFGQELDVQKPVVRDFVATRPWD